MITIGKHLSKYQTKKDYNDNEYTHVKPHISYIVNPIKQLIYIQKNKYTSRYFTIEALEDGLTVQLSRNALYRIDNQDWNTLYTNSNTPSINTGQKISFKIDNPIISSHGIGTFTVNKAFNVEGNIMSLLYGDNFEGQIDLSGKNKAFYTLFNNCTTLQNAENLILPANTLANSCYNQMFLGCTSLTTAPKLPATTLANDCYVHMFSGCTSLTTPPELPATTLADYCYQSMFFDCTSLTEAPKLPATTLACGCYSSMFSGCTSLTTPPELPATTLIGNCYFGMFRGCTSLPAAPQLPATKLASFCYANMFYGCSKLNKITMLATDISAIGCLTSWVFDVSESGTFVKHPDMTSLPSGTSGIPEGWTVKNVEIDYSKEYFTLHVFGDGDLTLYVPSYYTTAPSYSVNGRNWVTFTSNTILSLKSDDIVRVKCITEKYAIANNMYDYKSSFDYYSNSYEVYGNIMSLVYGDNFVQQLSLNDKNKHVFCNLFYQQTQLQNANNLILPSTTLAGKCYSGMFCRCSSLTTAPELPATTLAEYCYHAMFTGCTSLTTAPELPATTLANSCYHDMFDRCTSLTTAPELPVTTLAQSCYRSMFINCTSLTTAPELPATTLVYACYEYMFKGCSKLNKVTMLATDISANSCLSGWVYGVANTGTFIKHKNMTTLTTGTSGIPSGWTVVNDGETNVETNLITFYVDNTEYQAEEGMTWEEWVNSEYNTGGYILHLSQSFGDIYDSTGNFVIVYYPYGNYLRGVEALDLIESNHKYSLSLN